ncbi:MAG: YwiC-like family protein, partial [Candidatus Kapaibacterium sp.]
MDHFSFPKEHGAYVVLFAGWLFGIIYSPCNDIAGFVLALIFACSLFFLQEPIRILFRGKGKRNIRLHRFSIIFILTAILSGILLMIRSSRILYLAFPLMIIAIVYFSLVRKRTPAIALSLIGFSGLALITPLTIVASNCAIAVPDLATIWLFSSLFFWGSLVCVNIRLSGVRAIAPAAGYHLFACAVTILFVRLHDLPNSAIAVIAVSCLRLIVISLYYK